LEADAMRLRQLVVVARDLEPVVDEICQKLGVEVCYRDPGVRHFGLRNALMAVGDCFIEVVSPIQDGTAAGRYLERRGGDGGYMLLLQVDDLAKERSRIDELGVRVVWEGSGDGIRGMHLHPADIGGTIVSLDVAGPPDSWGWAGTDWRRHVRSEVVTDIAGAELQSDAPSALARRWSRALGCPVERGAERGEPVLNLDGGVIRFVTAGDGRGEGLGGFDLVAADKTRAGESIELTGVRVRLV
jgi:hypothetical protein